MRADDGLLLGVLDDDPTGSQAVHDVQVVTVLDEEAYGAAFAGPAGTCFVLTNSRSLAEPAAAEVTERAARGLMAAAGRRGARIQLVSRSDSTLRGHVMAEVAALRSVHREVSGRDVDGVLLAPAFLEAGRVTAGGIHWARGGGPGGPGPLVPVGQTEFARDAAFGYQSSDLRDFVAEKSGGRTRPGDVRSISLTDIRRGGPDRVRELLAGVRNGTWVIVDATEYSDLETVAYGVLQAERAGSSLAVPDRAVVRAGAPGPGPQGAAARRPALARGAPAGARAGRGRLARGADEPADGRADRAGRGDRGGTGRPGPDPRG